MAGLWGAARLLSATGLWAALRAGPTLGGRSANVCRMQLFIKLPKERKGRCHGLGPLLEWTQQLLLTEVPPGALTSTASSPAQLSQPEAGSFVCCFPPKCKPARGRERLCHSQSSPRTGLGTERVRAAFVDCQVNK